MSVSEASIDIVPTQNQDKNDALGQNEPNFAPGTQRTCNQSHFPVNQCTSNQAPAAVISRHTSDQSFKSTRLPTATLPKNTKKRKQSSMIKHKMKKKKINAPSNENNANQKKGRKWECILEAEVLGNLDHRLTLFDIFQLVTGTNELLEIIVTEMNRYAT